MNNYDDAAIDNNNRKEGKSISARVTLPYGWNRPSLCLSPWKKGKMSKELTMDNVKTGRLLGGETPTPEEVTLTTGAIKKKRKTFEIFHWKFMVLSVLFVFGLCATTVLWFTTVYYEIIFRSLTLGNGTKLHLAWKNPPLEPLLCVHLFNYTNAKRYFIKSRNGSEELDAKLRVQDTGPYCFRERIERKYIEFLNNGTQMSYREQRSHTFVPEASNGSLQDTVFVPNVLMISAYKKISEESSFSRFFKEAAISNSEILREMKVEDYLFGYEDPLFSTITDFRSWFVSDEPPIPKRFGVLQKRTGLSNDTVVINTGDGNLEEMGQVVQINNITEFTAWSTDECNAVAGSDGLFFRRSMVTSQQRVELFHKDSCRTLPLEFNSTVQLPGGISANRYRLKMDIFDPTKTENQCYFNETSRYGVLEISKCSAVSGAPIVLSRPHFLNSNANTDADGSIIIEGLEPDLAKHDFHIDIFTPIGLTVRTLMRMQLNIAVKNPSNTYNLQPIKDDTILPMAWIEMNSGETVPEKMYSLLYHLTYTVRWGELALKWIMLLFTFAVAFFLFKISFPKSSKQEVTIVAKP